VMLFKSVSTFDGYKYSSAKKQNRRDSSAVQKKDVFD